MLNQGDIACYALGMELSKTNSYSEVAGLLQLCSQKSGGFEVNCDSKSSIKAFALFSQSQSLSCGCRTNYWHRPMGFADVLVTERIIFQSDISLSSLAHFLFHKSLRR